MSNTISSSQLMMQQMQQMQLQAKSNPMLETNPLLLNNGQQQDVSQVNASVDGKTAKQVSFSDLLVGAVNHVNGMQQHSGQLKKDFTMGKEGVDLVEVMVASEKASVAFTALLETRNKLMKAYNEIKNTRV